MQARFSEQTTARARLHQPCFVRAPPTPIAFLYIIYLSAHACGGGEQRERRRLAWGVVSLVNGLRRAAWRTRKEAHERALLNALSQTGRQVMEDQTQGPTWFCLGPFLDLCACARTQGLAMSLRVRSLFF